MGKQRGGNVLLGLGISITLFYLVFYALILWGLIRWYTSTVDVTSKAIAVLFMFLTCGAMYFSIFKDED
jgi:hypothetical protein|uniref:Uncharacterized protein n=1 Tax=viral metagenome TaxID=1070528 RepID=A0A6C0CSS5_9ZZZZ